MNLDHLRYFEVLAEIEHYGKAAEKLNISQPTLTYAISQLEDELELPLFEKKGRRINLTYYGEEFRKTVSSTLSLLDKGTREVKENGKNGKYIVIGGIRTLASTIVPKLMRDFMDTVPYPIKFSLTTIDGFSSSILRAVEEGKLDYGFTSISGENDVFETIPFEFSRFVVIAPKMHPLSQKDEITLEETLPYPQILFSEKSGLRKSIDCLYSQINASPSINMETEEDAVVAGLVAAGFGIAVVPYNPLLESLKLKIITLKSPESKRIAYLSRLRGTKLPEAAERFWDFSKKALKSQL